MQCPCSFSFFAVNNTSFQDVIRVRLASSKGAASARMGVMYMAKAFAKKFYSSKAWQDCRNRYAAKRGHLCENCLRKGIYRPGEIVHHKIEIDPVTIYNPEVSLNPDNLELLCRDCHAEMHKSYQKGRRFVIGVNGEVLTDGIL